MAMEEQTITTVDLETEWHNAEQAIQELEETGHTDRRCLRCGGALLLEDRGSAYIIRCERDDVQITSRGI